MTLVRPQLMPDEFGAGYWGRMMRINGFAKWLPARRYLLEAMPEMESSAPAASQLLAAVAGIGITDFLRRHTLMPLSRNAIVEKSCNVDRNLVVERVVDRTMKKGAFFCVECIDEDCCFHGFAYWRRSHQIPGLFWCEKHVTPLRAASGEKCFRRSPIEFLDKSAAFEEAWVSSLQLSPPVRRFHEIAEYLLDIEKPLNERLVKMVVLNAWRRRCARQGDPPAPVAGLSDIVSTSLDTQWLESITSSRVTGIGEKEFGAVLSPERLKITVVHYMLSLAVLFETAEEAVKAVEQERATVSYLKRPASTASVKWREIVHAYVCACGDSRIAAAILGLQARSLRKRIAALGLPLLENLRPDARRRAVDEIVAEKRVLKNACAMAGLPEAGITSILQQAIEPTRRHSEAAEGMLQVPIV